MDPLKIELAVSAETDRRIHPGDEIKIGIPGLNQTRLGTIFQRDTVADPATRTFNVTIVVRNEKIQIPHRPEVKLPRVKEFRLLRSLDVGKQGPLFIERKSVYRDASGTFTWRFSQLTREGLSAEFDSIQPLERVDVSLSRRVIEIPGGFTFTELAADSRLQIGELLACGVPENFKSGGKVLVVRERWLFRPGELVTVQLPRTDPGSGWYVPMQAILQHEGGHHVFLVDGEKGVPKAVQVSIRLLGELGQLRRIEPTDAQRLVEGAEIVLAGAAYLRGGEEVHVVEKEKVAP